MPRKVLVILLLAAVTVLGGARPAHAIAYGEDTADGAYRFSVLLTMTGLPDADGGLRDSSCSGALIADRWVITAGHCFRDGDGRRVDRPVARRTTAIIGRADLRTHEGYEVEVAAVHQADDTDVALAELAEPVTGITPIRLAAGAPQVGEVLRLTGFGLVVRDGATTPTDRMQTGRFTVGAVGDTMIEASGAGPRPETSPCPHDSGGPYFRELPDGTAELVAVVSDGPGCPHPGPDYSARVDNLADWVTATTTGRFPAAAAGFGVAGLLVAAAVLTGAVRRRAHR